MHAAHRLALIASLLVAGTTCSRKPTRVAPTAPISLTVENHYQADVRIFIVHDGQTTRLGLVPRAVRSNFFLPRRVIGISGAVRLLADPIAGSGRFPSEPVVVQPGQQIVWVLESDLRRSSLAVY